MNQNHQNILPLHPILTHVISYFCDINPLQYYISKLVFQVASFEEVSP